MSRGVGGTASRTGRPARWALHMALVVGLAAWVVAREDRAILLLLVPLALAPAVRWTRAPRSVAVVLPAIAKLALLVLFVFAISWRQLRLVPDGLGLWYSGVLGWTLAVLSVVFILGHQIWPATTTLLPTIVGLFVASGLKPGVGLFVYEAAAGALALWVFALLHGGPRRFGSRLAAFVAVAVMVSAGTVWLLPWAQPHVERAVARTFAEGTTGLSTESRLGEFGELAVSNRVVLRVWTSRPRLLRAYVFSRFDGREWSSGYRGEGGRDRALLPENEAARRSVLSGVPGNLFVVEDEGRLTSSVRLDETRVLQSAVADWPLLVPASRRLVRAPAPYLLESPEGELRWPPYLPARLYGIAHDGGRPGAPQEREGILARAVALGLPARLDPRLRVLAGSLAADAVSDRTRVRRTVAWLRSSCGYRLDVGRFETADPLAEFLFEKKAGYCEYFATAAAVLLRLQGIPTRYVKGFGVGPQNRIPGRLGVGDHYRVREADAHAWIDVWVEDRGWIEVDPTPPGEIGREDGSPGWLEGLVEAVRAHGAEMWARVRHEGWAGLLGATRGVVRAVLGSLWQNPWAAGVAVIVLLAAAGRRTGWGWWKGVRLRSRRRRERRAALPAGLDALLATVERRWARQGVSRAPARGLREHLEHLPVARVSLAERAVSAAVVDACYRAAYRGTTPGHAEIERLRRELERLGP